MDEEQLVILRRFANPIRANTLDMIARDYEVTVKEIKARIRRGVKSLIEYYAVKEGLREG